MTLPASLREYVIARNDIFHALSEGEFLKSRQRFKTLLLNARRARGGTKKAIKAAYARSLDAVDRWGAAVPSYSPPGCRTLTQYHEGWTTATAFFGWDHVALLTLSPMGMGFRDTVLPRRLKNASCAHTRPSKRSST